MSRSESQAQSQDEASIDLGIPKKGGKEGYLFLFFTARQQIGSLIAHMEGITDPRLEVFTRYMISSITDAETRSEILDEMDRQLDEIGRERTGVEERARAAMVVYMDALGAVSDWYDDFLGITHRLVIGTV